jgi:formylglycine-generating enzyme required for sulfatase activity
VDAESARFRPNYTSTGFWLGKFEVTQAEWTAMMGTNPSAFNGKNGNAALGPDTSRFPVDSVSWHDCESFIKKLNERAEAATPVFGTRVRFALPHEDEWEYACQGGLGNDRPFHFGGELDGRQANADATVPWGALGKGTTLGRPTTVGSYERGHPHPWGLCDMHGNVMEWCENRYSPSEDARVLRGGSGAVPPLACRSAARAPIDSGARGDRGGVRVCVRPMSDPAPSPKTAPLFVR